MKKILLFAAALTISAGMFAQSYAVIDTTTAGIVSAGTELQAGTVMAVATDFEVTAGITETFKATSAAADGFTSICIGTTEIPLTSACQGSNNPKDGDGASPATSLKAPATGCAYQIVPNNDGFMYVVNKMTSNKQYFVFEEGTAIGYEASMYTADTMGIITVTLPGDGTEINAVPEGTTIAKIEVLAGAAEDSYKKSGVGVIKFPVYKECKYLVGAAGSKMTAGAFYFSTNANEEIVLKGADVADTKLFAVSGLQKAMNNASVVSSRYFLLSGEEVCAPQQGAQGLYIVKNLMSDGSVNVSKMMLR